MPEPTRIVIVGGGFAGTTVARELERQFRRDRSVEITPRGQGTVGTTAEPEFCALPSDSATHVSTAAAALPSSPAPPVDPSLTMSFPRLTD